MNRTHLSFLSLLLIAGTANASVEVDFIQPESYTDAGIRAYNDANRATVVRNLRVHLEKLGTRYLPEKQQLKIEILDIDLAGRLEPWQPYNYDVRYLREITWPRIKLRYTLEEAGLVIGTAEETVTDMTYLQHVNRYFDSDQLRYEKSMLDDWFRNRFTKSQPLAN